MKGLGYLDDTLNRAVYYFSDMNNFRVFRRLSTQLSASLPESRAGFTLIELVMVIAIIGILASLALPKFQDLSGAAKVSATKAGLGSLRAVLATRYAASATGGATASFPASLTTADFAGAEAPKNALTGNSGVNALAVTVAGTVTHATLGFWYVSDNTNAAGHAGKCGAYSDGTTNTSAY